MNDTDFRAPNIGRTLERLAPEEIDRLPYGVVRLSDDGRVTMYSRAEAKLSGFGDRPVLNRHFFEQVAPCMDTPMLRARVDAEARSGTMDIELGHTGDFADPSRFVRIRAVSASGGGLWLLLQR